MSGVFPVSPCHRVRKNSDMDNISYWNHSSSSGGHILSGRTVSTPPVSAQGKVNDAGLTQTSHSVLPSSSSPPQNLSKFTTVSRNCGKDENSANITNNHGSSHRNLLMFMNQGSSQLMPCANFNSTMSSSLKDLSQSQRILECGQNSPVAVVPTLQDKESHSDIHNGSIASDAVLSSPACNGEVTLKTASASRIMSRPFSESENVGSHLNLSHDNDLKENIVQAVSVKGKPNLNVSSKTSLSIQLVGDSDPKGTHDKAPINDKLFDNSAIKTEAFVRDSTPVLNIGSSVSTSAQDTNAKELKVLSLQSSSGLMKQDVHDVESQMEALFAGIADDGKNMIESNSLGDLSDGAQGTPNIAAVLSSKSSSLRKGKAKTSNGLPKAADSIFGTSSADSTPRKRRRKKPVKDKFGIEGKSKKLKKSCPAKGKFFKEASCDNGSVSSLSRARGPVVHIEGPKEAPTLVTVVNAPSRLDDEENDYRKKSGLVNRVRKVHSSEVSCSGLCGSSLISRYEAQSNDPRWVCVFCKKGCHVNGLGDLFGPYLVKQEYDSGNHFCLDVTADRKPADKKNKRSGFGQTGIQGLLPIPPLPNEPCQYMVWFHENCAVWASGVHLVGSRLVGLQEAVWMAVNSKCVRCNADGAVLGCNQHGCSQRVHYPCAIDDGWNLDEDLFISMCHLHHASRIKL